MTKFPVTIDFLHEGDITIISQSGGGGGGLAQFSADIFFLTEPKFS